MEKHLYSDQFFKFVNEIINGVVLPDIPQELLKEKFYPKYELQEISTRNVHKKLINIIYNLIFNLLSRVHDNDVNFKIQIFLLKIFFNKYKKIICNYSVKLKDLLYLNPDCAFDLFKQLATDKNLLELMLICPDRQVRSNTVGILLFLINIIISFNNLDLDLTKYNENVYFITIFFFFFIELIIGRKINRRKFP